MISVSYYLKREIILNGVQISIDTNGEPLTDGALAAAKSADAVLLGAIGGPVGDSFLLDSCILGVRNVPTPELEDFD